MIGFLRKNAVIVIVIVSGLIGSLLVVLFESTSPQPELIEGLLSQPSSADVSTLIDYDLPFYKRRLWVIARHDGYTDQGKIYNQGDVVMNTWVSHAFRSGFFSPRYFSNKPQSFLSSRGLMTTNTEVHKSNHHGYPALKVTGSDSVLNSNVLPRYIIFHKAFGPWSLGCFQTWPSINKRLTTLIAGQTLLYVHKSNPIDVANPAELDLPWALFAPLE